MPRSASLTARQNLIEAAIRRLEESGPDALQARKLAVEVGMSTMAVYTYFGGLAELIHEVALEGDRRLGAHLSGTPVTDDPLTDLFVQGMAYRDWARRHPQLYRLIFGLTGVSRPGPGPKTATGDAPAGAAEDAPTGGGESAFAALLRTIERVKAAGQVGGIDPVAATGQFLSASHGFVLLEPTGLFADGGRALQEVSGPLGMSVMTGLGASAQDVQGAMAAAVSAQRGTRTRSRRSN